MANLQKQAILPNLIIAGVTKAGTTSLFTYLKMHPQICASKVKETCYFLPLRYGTEMSPIEDYLEQFKGCNNTKYIMEATPGYYYGGEKIATAIKQTTGNAHVIVLLREPVSRMFSFYKYLKSRVLLPDNITFSSYVDRCQMDSSPSFESENLDLFWGIEGGFYDNYIDDWRLVFGDRLKVIFFEDIVSDPRKTLRAICDWLSIDPQLFDSVVLETENRSVNYRFEILQKGALLLNDGAEQFWRYFPKLKGSLRTLYYSINGKDFEEKITGSLHSKLDSVFLPHNKRLAVQLADMGYHNLPYWLTFA